jgi:uncharacterized protein
LTRIGLVSDTHGFFDDAIPSHFEQCDEVWHIGDFGDMALVGKWEAACGKAGLRTLRGVYGNIDGAAIRALYPEALLFDCEGVKVLLQHIGGYPGRYAPGIKQRIVQEGVGLFISGHSHILKVMYDKDLQCLHINPGAAGRQGWHKMRTLVRFAIDGKEIKDCEVIELGPRG